MSRVHRTDEEAARQQRGQGAPIKMANACMESFYDTMRREWIRGQTIATFRELEAAPTAYIRFYNHRRLHSGIDYRTPEEYERVVT